jgi:hypothetical protein
VTTPDPQVFPELDVADVENFDPYEGMDFEPADPLEQAHIPQGTPQGTGKDTEPEPVGFDPRYREDFEGLTFIGALQTRFSFLGHKIVMRTLTTHELLAVGMIMKEFRDTAGEMTAYATAMVALSLVSVDGRGLAIPLSDEGQEYDWAFIRFHHIAARWHAPVIDGLYERYLLLEGRVNQVLDEMVDQAKKASGRTESTPG